jgi:heme/copper-type cytochrome/quinol oxidase subunit 3
MSTPSTSMEHETHELAPHIRVARARAGVLLLIISDALAVLAIFAGGGYLSALNTENQFRIAGDHAPAFLPGLLVAIVLVLSGLAYYWWERNMRQGAGTTQQMLFLLAWVLVIVAMVAQFVISVTVNRAYTTPPYDAYESVITLVEWFTAIHLLLAAIIGLLLYGRILRGRIAGHEYVVEVTGYWWYYTVVASLLMWLFAMLFA